MMNYLFDLQEIEGKKKYSATLQKVAYSHAMSNSDLDGLNAKVFNIH